MRTVRSRKPVFGSCAGHDRRRRQRHDHRQRPCTLHARIIELCVRSQEVIECAIAPSSRFHARRRPGPRVRRRRADESRAAKPRSRWPASRSWWSTDGPASRAATCSARPGSATSGGWAPDSATTLKTPVALRFGSVDVPPGEYVLKAKKVSDKEWALKLEPRGQGRGRGAPAVQHARQERRGLHHRPRRGEGPGRVPHVVGHPGAGRPLHREVARDRPDPIRPSRGGTSSAGRAGFLDRRTLVALSRRRDRCRA